MLNGLIYSKKSFVTNMVFMCSLLFLLVGLYTITWSFGTAQETWKECEEIRRGNRKVKNARKRADQGMSLGFLLMCTN